MWSFERVTINSFPTKDLNENLHLTLNCKSRRSRSQTRVKVWKSYHQQYVFWETLYMPPPAIKDRSWSCIVTFDIATNKDFEIFQLFEITEHGTLEETLTSSFIHVLGLCCQCIFDNPNSLCVLQIDAPGAWLSGRGDVYLRVSLFGKSLSTKLCPSVFPMHIHEDLEFEKVRIVLKVIRHTDYMLERKGLIWDTWVPIAISTTEWNKIFTSSHMLQYHVEEDIEYLLSMRTWNLKRYV